MKTIRQLSGTATACVSLLAAASAHALSFNFTYDSSLTNSLGAANAYSVQQGFATAGQFFQNTFTDPITINVGVYWGNAGGFAGDGFAASISTGYSSTYTNIRSALFNDKTTAADNTSFTSGTVAAADPFGALTNLTRANAKAIGLVAANDAPVDGKINFGSNTFSLFTLDPTNRAVAGKYDFIGVVEHELSEVMGRISWLDVPSKGNYLMDLFRYTGPGARNTSIGAGVSGVKFSYDNGTNLFTEFNAKPGGDPNDWATNNVIDSFNAYVDLPDSKGSLLPVSTTDKTVMDVIGYDLVPEPTVAALLGIGALAIVTRVRSRRR